MNNYERDHSHFHCWDQDQEVPDCGIKKEDHKQCCLCDKKPDRESFEDRTARKLDESVIEGIKTLQEMNIEEILKLIKDKGLTSFILMHLSPEGLITSHIESVSARNAFAILITGFTQVVENQINADPKSKEILLGLLNEFKESVKSANTKLVALRGSGSGPGIA